MATQEKGDEPWSSWGTRVQGFFQKYTGRYLLLLNVDVLWRGVKDESWVCDLASWYQKLRRGSSGGTGLIGEDEEVEFGA